MQAVVDHLSVCCLLTFFAYNKLESASPLSHSLTENERGICRRVRLVYLERVICMTLIMLGPFDCRSAENRPADSTNCLQLSGFPL